MLTDCPLLQGFNSKGYNERGRHYKNVAVRWVGPINTTHRVTTERKVLAGIVEGISRHAEISQEDIPTKDGSWRWIKIHPGS